MTFQQPSTPQSPLQPSAITSGLASAAKSLSYSSTTDTLPTPAHSISGVAKTQSSNMPPLPTMAPNSPLKRKRSADDLGDQDHKKVNAGTARSYIFDLHLDVGKKYLLCGTCKAPSDLCTALVLRSLFFSCLASLLSSLPLLCLMPPVMQLSSGC